VADWKVSETWTLGGNAERLRAHLRTDGWTEWREEHARNADAQLHVTNIFNRVHERGPLVEFVHPAHCLCLDNPNPFPKWILHNTACLKGQRHELPCDPPGAETCVLEHKHGGSMPCWQRDQ
jgi:hypothetical protein